MVRPWIAWVLNMPHNAVDMDRTLPVESVEGEIALVIDYRPGQSEAIAVLSGAMRFIESLDKLDHCLLSSIDTALEPVSILNDIQHSSLKILLARALRKVPDDALGSLEWKRWIGGILVKGKYLLLNRLDSDEPGVRQALLDLEDSYKAAPGEFVGYTPPSISDTRAALRQVANARTLIPDGKVTVQTEMGDVEIPRVETDEPPVPVEEPLSKNLLKDQVLIIESAVFKDGNQWRFSDGSMSFPAAITDQEFILRVDAGERFGKGDHLVVDLVVEQIRVGTKISTRREVQAVKEHKDRNLQLILGGGEWR